MSSHPGRRQLAIFAAGYLTYFGVRALTERRADRAFRHAAEIVDFERWAGIAWEGAIQGLVAGSRALQRASVVRRTIHVGFPGGHRRSHAPRSTPWPRPRPPHPWPPRS
jgi:hypothetical protein